MKLLSALLIVMGLSGAMVVASPVLVGAVNVVGDACDNNPDSAICKNADEDVSGVVGTVVNTLLFLLGAVSVIMIIIAGIRFATTGSDAASVQSARNTILYAVVGLVVALLAYAIVNWVFNLFG